MMRLWSVTAALAALAAAALASPAAASHLAQCPGDLDGDGVSDTPGIVCIHLTASDGFLMMGDGEEIYSFGFHDVTGVDEDLVLSDGRLGAEAPAPTITVREGDDLYLTLTTTPMTMRPDLFDPHTVHFHGFPNASAVFDGEPMSSLAINQGASFTYYYHVVEPGTFMYHCHVEASEHMQMGMLGNLYVTPAQDLDPGSDPPISFGGRDYWSFAYNDTDGSTGYDRAYPVQIASFDPVFHAMDQNVQPLPFAAMHDTYPLMNGRGYPDTINPAPLAAPAQKIEFGGAAKDVTSQPVPSLITATAGERILLRLSSLATVDFYTVGILGLPMQVVGKDARIYRSGGDTAGEDLYYETGSVTLGGGESVDVILDTAAAGPGTYFLYAKNLNDLSNDREELGGMMTEIVVTP